MKKTLRSRIAAVAVAVVGLSLVNALPAQAVWTASGNTNVLNCTVAAVNVNDVCTQVVGGQVTLTTSAYASLTAATTYYIDVDGASIQSVTSADTANSGSSDALIYGSNGLSPTTGGGYTYGPSNSGISWPTGTYTSTKAGGDPTITVYNNGADADGLIYWVADNTTMRASQTIKLQKLTAGDTTVTIFYYDSLGRRQTLETNTINWVSSTSVYAMSVTNSFAYVTNAAACQAAGTNHQGDLNNYNGNDFGQASAPAKTGSTDDLIVCVYLRNGLDQPIASDTLGVTLVTTLGVFASNSQKSRTATITTTNGGIPTGIQIDGVTGELGTAQITVLVTDLLGNVRVMPQMTGNFFGPLASLTLGNVSTSLLYSATSTTRALSLKAYDAAGTQIDLGATTGFTNAITYTVDSDQVSTTPADRTSDSSGGSASNGFAKSSQIGTYGYNFVTVGCASVAEKLTVTAWGKDADGLYTVKSGSVVIYCARAATTLGATLTLSFEDNAGAAVTTVAKGGTFRVQVAGTEVNGYPIPDATTLTLTATDAGAMDYYAGTFLNGKYYRSSTGSTDLRPLVTAKNDDGTITITAAANGVTFATKSIAVGTGVNNSGAIAAADAAKAEAAKATAAVAALATTVTSIQTAISTLVASVTATLTTMSAQINKIMKKLKIK